MSFEHIAIAINHTRATGAVRAVMVGIASHANDDGEAYPGMMKLAQYAGYEGWDALPEDDTSEAKAKAREARSRARRSAIKAVQKLQELGEVEVIVNGGGSRNRPEHMRPNLYRITLTCPPNCDHSAQHRLLTREETEARLRRALGLLDPVDNSESAPVASRPPRGLQATTPVASRPPEPSTNQPHLAEPESEAVSAGAREGEVEDDPADEPPTWQRGPLGQASANSYRAAIEAKKARKLEASRAQPRSPEAQAAVDLLGSTPCPAAPGFNHWFPPSMTECARGCGATITLTEQENAA